MSQRCAIHFQYFQSIACIQYCSWFFNNNFLVIFLLSDRWDVVKVFNAAFLVWKFINCDLIRGIYYVVIETSVGHHFVVVDIVRENKIFWELLSRSAFDLNIRFKTWWLIKRYDNFTLRNIETFLCHTGRN